MSTFLVTLEVGDPDGSRFESVSALVDTGATYTFLPASLLSRLGVTPHRRMEFEIADGSRMERGFGRTWGRLNGGAEVSPVIFGDEGVTPLLGAVTLEIFGLGVDPVNRRLIPVAALA